MNRRLVPHSRCLLLLALSSVLNLGAPSCAHSEGRGSKAAPPGDNGDNVCGPRCVAFLVKWYGKDQEDLVELVKEVQWPHIERGATLASLDSALRRRGIHTHALRISSSARLVWPYPVLVHLAPSPGTPEEEAGLGHFAVMLPSAADDSSVQLVDGLSPVRSVTSDEFASTRSGTVLLTAPAPIDDAAAAVQIPLRQWAVFLFGLAAVMVACVILTRAGRCAFRRFCSFPFWLLKRSKPCAPSC